MFPINYMDLYEINTNPSGVANWERLAEGLTGGVIANNDVVDQTTYLDGDGFGTSDVTGGQKTVAFTGHRSIGDPAQDYIVSIASSFGDARKTQFRYRDAQGKGFEAEVTITNIEAGGGDANAKKDISFEIHANGKPTEVPLALASDLTAVISAGTVTGTTSFTATPTGENTLAYRLSSSDKGAMYTNQYVDNVIGYTSGANINATAGQWLIMFELDTNGRLALVNSSELTAGDIA